MLPRSFYERDSSEVARDLLGKILVCEAGGRTSGIIVETEAYYGDKDPASKVFGRKSKDHPMYGEAGKVYVYVVHASWLLNIVTGKVGEAGAVLIRAVEPLEGIELMRERRGTKEITELTNGPGKLAKAMQIDGRMQGEDVCTGKLIYITHGPRSVFSIGTSHRIGVRRDVRRKLRFFIDGNRFVSR